MHWRSKTNLDNRGVGLPVENKREADQICREHNHLFPSYTHWAKDEDDNDLQDGKDG